MSGDCAVFFLLKSAHPFSWGRMAFSLEIQQFMSSFESTCSGLVSAFRHQAAWMIFIDGSGALSPMVVACVEHFSFFILSWECPFPGRGGLLPGHKTRSRAGGFSFKS
jgi:hypothetical protein